MTYNVFGGTLNLNQFINQSSSRLPVNYYVLGGTSNSVHTRTLTFSPDHFLTSCFRFLVLYTVYSSGLAALYLGHSK